MKKIPKVSVVCISYNQEEYIAQALEGFVSQKTDFTYEVVISDDMSTDRTPEIISEYAKKYPTIIKPVLRSSNVGPRINLIEALDKATGQYIALCEGDDFWTDSQKLQKQSDFLDKHTTYGLVFHPVRVFYENGQQKDTIFPAEKNGFTLENLLKKNYIQTNSVMYRARPKYNDIAFDIMPVDWYIHLQHAQFGKIGFIDEVMASYRKHSEGVWWSSAKTEAMFLKKIFPRHIQLFYAIRSLYSESTKYTEIINKAESEFVKRAVSLNIEDKVFLEEATEMSPKVMASVVIDLHKLKVAADKINDEQRKRIDEQAHLYDEILHSHSYRTGRAVTKPLRAAKKILKKN